MKTKTIITELSQEDLVNLLCTATYGSSWLAVSAPDTEGAGIEKGDCLEDVWAKALLAGKKVHCIDFYAEGETYGNLDRKVDKEENGIYQVGLQDVIDGLQKCLDGTFNHDDDDAGRRERRWLAECFPHLRDDSGEMDNPEAEALMQVIMFNELIY